MPGGDLGQGFVPVRVRETLVDTRPYAGLNDWRNT